MEKQDPIANLISTYHELNATIIDELTEEPSALEFTRYVAKNRPFVVRRGAKDWKACQQWNAAYLRDTMEGQAVNVAVTPLGNADAVVEQQGSSPLFVEPHEVREDFGDFLSYVQEDSRKHRAGRSGGNVKYAQTQNGNLREEYDSLYPDVPPDLPFVRIALAQPADAINFWLGNERSVTALHKDNYENIYVQVIGQKHFVLLPPIEQACVNEQDLARARYSPVADGSQELTIVVDREAEAVPVATWDPEEPGKFCSKFSKLSKPLHVTLREGDMMYLPAMWYHKVSQSSGLEGFACAVNYWYDMSFEGSFWASNNFVREVMVARSKEVQYPDLGGID